MFLKGSPSAVACLLNPQVFKEYFMYKEKSYVALDLKETLQNNKQKRTILFIFLE